MKTLEERQVEALEKIAERSWWRNMILIWILILIMCSVPLLARADSTFIPIVPEKPTVCQKVCPVCGNCVPVFGVGFYFCRSGRDSLGFRLPDSCSKVVWGRWRQVCRVDTTAAQRVVRICDSMVAGNWPNGKWKLVSTGNCEWDTTVYFQGRWWDWSPPDTIHMDGSEGIATKPSIRFNREYWEFRLALDTIYCDEEKGGTVR